MYLISLQVVRLYHAVQCIILYISLPTCYAAVDRNYKLFNNNNNHSAVVISSSEGDLHIVIIIISNGVVGVPIRKCQIDSNNMYNIVVAYNVFGKRTKL